MYTTTTFELPGFRITKPLGVVRGITVRTRALPMSIIGGLRTLFGGRVGIFTDLCETAREESFQLMLEHARRKGANAVVGVRYDTGPMVGSPRLGLGRGLRGHRRRPLRERAQALRGRQGFGQRRSGTRRLPRLLRQPPFRGAGFLRPLAGLGLFPITRCRNESSLSGLRAR